MADPYHSVSQPVHLRQLSMETYFNYFTEIEEHFQRRRGTLLLLSPLDWALMETWKDAGIPLEAVLRGIDATFEKWERRPKRFQKVNGLAYCSQEVLTSAEEMKEAAVGAPSTEAKNAGLDQSAVVEYLNRNAEQLDRAAIAGDGANAGPRDRLDLARSGGFVVAGTLAVNGRPGATTDGGGRKDFGRSAGGNA